MSDVFVDALYARLRAVRDKAATDREATTQSNARRSEAARAWWKDFVLVLENKLLAWNAMSDADAHLTYRQTPAGSLVLWHRSVEAELQLVDSRVVLTGRTGDTTPRESPFIVFQENRGDVVALLTGEPVGSPSDAADRLLEPILTRAFSG